MSDGKQSAPPYVSYRTFKNQILRLANDGRLPDRIDASCARNLSGAVTAQFLSSLRSLDLISEDGTPSAALKKLASARDSWAQEFKPLMGRFYAAQIQSAENGTPKTLQESFQNQFKATGSTLDKAIRFFLAAASECGITVSPVILKGVKTTSPGVRRPNSRRKSTSNPASAAGSGDEANGHQQADVSAPAADPWLSKYPEFDPAWPAEIQAQWFEGFKRLMDLKKGGA